MEQRRLKMNKKKIFPLKIMEFNNKFEIRIITERKGGSGRHELLEVSLIIE